jgi:transcriptional regulator with XRE-family HTH domain
MIKIVGKNIKRQREKQGMTQSELGKSLGISTPSVSKIESGMVNLSIDRIRQIGEVFNLSFQELFYDNGQYGVNEFDLNELSRLKHLTSEREIYLNQLRTRLIFLHEELRRNAPAKDIPLNTL